eukprot:4340009-Pyramimonas_sp.AAC.1
MYAVQRDTLGFNFAHGGVLSRGCSAQRFHLSLNRFPATLSSACFCPLSFGGNAGETDALRTIPS